MNRIEKCRGCEGRVKASKLPELECESSMSIVGFARGRTYESIGVARVGVWVLHEHCRVCKRHVRAMKRGKFHTLAMYGLQAVHSTGARAPRQC